MNPQIAFLLNRSIESLRSSNIDSASLYLRQALRLQANNPDVLRLLGVIAAQKKQYAEALNYLKTSLKFHPKNPLTLSNLGNVYLILKDYSSALEAYDRSIKIEPRYEEAWSAKGNALYELKRYEESLVHHDMAISLNPNYAEAYSNKGNTLNELKRYEEALVHHDRALSLKPDYAVAFYNKGNALYQIERYVDAIACYDQALNLRPDYFEVYYNKGNALNELKYYVDAIACYDQVISLKPDYAGAYCNKGNALNELKYYADAIACYDQALLLEPNVDWIIGNLIHAKMKLCDWNNFSTDVKLALNKATAQKKSMLPFIGLTLSDNTTLHKNLSQIYTHDKYPIDLGLGKISIDSKKERIKLGYFSANFHNHAIGYLVAELFELHDKNLFELVGFSFGPIVHDEMRQRLVKSFDQFIEVGNSSDLEIAKLSRHLNIDIAIDLMGLTQDARTGIFSYRAAPIQINYLGYPGTMGADYMDYIIADRILVPDDSKEFYSEKVVYLPNTYQANDRNKAISENIFTRQELGLPEKSFVFCCFNNNFKILPETFECWMRILKAVDGSVLWLLQDNQWVVSNLKKEAEKYGVDANRLVFAERAPLAEHLARHRQADLFLDTLPYNAHTTASDALWAELPVLTVMGNSFASRVAASLLSAIDLPELIASSQEEYESLAIELAIDLKKLSIIKKKLVDNRLLAPLFDTPLFTKNLETAYIKMHERYQEGLPPEQISID